MSKPFADGPSRIRTRILIPPRAFASESTTRGVLSQRVRVAEQKAEALRRELLALEGTATDVFKAPPVEWVTERLGKVQEVLERETTRSALLLRRVLGPIRLAPITPEVGRPYYQAETALQVLELIQDPEGSSNSLSWWRRWESNPRPETLSRRRLRR